MVAVWKGGEGDVSCNITEEGQRKVVEAVWMTRRGGRWW